MTWPEFFDAKNFPGRRGIRTRVNDTLEMAAMGSGVAPSEVFPIDVERAFKALDRIKPHVSHMISATSQTVSLIQQNETDFTFTYTNRVKKMQDAGVPMDFSFKQNICGIAWTGMLRGSKNHDASMQFLNFMLEADRQAELANLSYSAPTNADGMPMVDPAVRKWLPDVASKNNCFTDAEWWSKNLEPLTIRYKEWMLT
jgi:putative spermidine/putrescine transport system substrate-binding protein